MAEPPTIFVAKERQVWMRLQSHTVVFDREPDFPRYSRDPSGVIVRVLHLWLAEHMAGALVLRHYLGSVRFSGRWMSRAELQRLFRRATRTAQLTGQPAAPFRSRLSRFLRDYFGLQRRQTI